MKNITRRLLALSLTAMLTFGTGDVASAELHSFDAQGHTIVTDHKNISKEKEYAIHNALANACQEAKSVVEDYIKTSGNTIDEDGIEAITSSALTVVKKIFQKPEAIMIIEEPKEIEKKLDTDDIDDEDDDENITDKADKTVTPAATGKSSDSNGREKDSDKTADSSEQSAVTDQKNSDNADKDTDAEEPEPNIVYNVAVRITATLDTKDLEQLVTQYLEAQEAYTEHEKSQHEVIRTEIRKLQADRAEAEKAATLKTDEERPMFADRLFIKVDLRKPTEEKLPKEKITDLKADEQYLKANRDLLTINRLQQAAGLAEIGDYENALDMMNEMEALDMMDNGTAFPFHYLRAFTYRHLKPEDPKKKKPSYSIEDEFGPNEKAAVDFTRAIRVRNRYAPAYTSRGLTYYDLERYDKAAFDFTKSIMLDSKHAYVYYNRGLSDRHLREYERAVSDFTKAIALDGDYAEAYYDRGVAYQLLGQQEEAIADYDKVVALQSADADVYNSRGFAYEAMEQYDEAIEDYTKAISLNDECALYYVNRGDAFRLTNQYDKALMDYQKALSLEMEGPRAESAMSGIAEIRAEAGTSEIAGIQPEYTFPTLPDDSIVPSPFFTEQIPKD